MEVYINKETHEVINKERFEQIVNELLFDSDLRLNECYELVSKTWIKFEVTGAIVKSECNRDNCIYHVNGGCGAPLTPMAGCPKTREA